jgi:hypothetical protein
MVANFRNLVGNGSGTKAQRQPDTTQEALGEHI